MTFTSPWLNTIEAASYVRRSKRTMEGLRISGGGPAYHRQGGIVLYHRDDLDAWLAPTRAAHVAQEKIEGRL